MGYWLDGSRENVRKLLENYAKRQSLDPLIPENWYSVTRNAVTSFKVGIQRYF